MNIGGKEAMSIRLHCPLQCGGYIENEILLYLLEDDSLYFYGKCGECGQSGNITISLIELLSQCPTSVVQ